MSKKKKNKKQKERVDGLGPSDIKRIRSAIRMVWHWSWPRKLCANRALGKDGFSKCEKCKKRAPKVFIDHIVPVGNVDAGFIVRLWCPSNGLQALCKKCHDEKTKEERKLDASIREVDSYLSTAPTQEKGRKKNK